MAERVLVIGGAGFIGSHTVDLLLAGGFDVRVLDLLVQPVHIERTVPAYLAPEAEFLLGDARDRDVLSTALENVDYVFHLAAHQGYGNEFASFFDVNATSTALLYELILSEKLPIKRVVVASSQFVQGEGLYRDSKERIVAPGFRTREALERGEWDHRGADNRVLQWMATPSSHAHPTNAYSLSKHAQEQSALVLGRRFSIPTVVLRYSIVQGARQSFTNLYSGACRIFSLSYHTGRAPILFEDGHQVRDYVNVLDVAEANLLFMTSDIAEPLLCSVGGGTPVSILEFDRIVATVFDRRDLQPRVPGQFRFGDTRHAVSDIEPTLSYGWTPRYSIADSVEQFRVWIEGSEVDRTLIDGTLTELESRGIVGHVQ